MRKTYEAPRLVLEGTVVDLTGGTSVGSRYDVDFPIGTPRGKLTFS